MAAAVAEPRGLKRICPSCGTRYYDLNKRPPVCPSCTTEFKTEVKTKGRRTRLAAANDELAKVKPVAKPAEDPTEIAAEGDEEIVSLSEVEDLEEAADEEDVDALDPDLDDDVEGVDDEEAELEEDAAVEDDKA